jgi:hypothetical protein
MNRLEAQSSNVSHFCTGMFNYPVFIRVDKSKKTLVCRLSDLMVYSGRLVLSDFQILDQAWIDRQCERIQPKQPAFVSMIKNTNKTNAKACLFDLSEKGMCVLVEKNELGIQNDPADAEYQIRMELAPNEPPFKVKARVVQKQPLSDGLWRLGMDISLSKKDIKKVAHFLTERKREILDELFLNFLGLLNYREAKDLYF